MFIYMLAVGMMAENSHLNQSNEAMFTVGYFLSGFAVFMTIGISIMTIKLKKINEINYKNKKKI